MLRLSTVGFLSIVGTFILISCSSPAGYWPDASWRSSPPEQQGIESSRLAAMFEHVAQAGYDVHSVLIIRHGYLVTEAYADPYTRDLPHDLFSCTKSVTGTLLGMTIGDGLVTNVGAHLDDFFADEAKDAGAGEIPLEALLTMSAGFPGIAVLRSADLAQKDDAVRFVLGLPRSSESNRSFIYSNASPHLVSAAVKKVTGSDTLFYAQDRLFDPLGIRCNRWPADKSGVQIGGSGLRLTPLDMAKLGYLYLTNGVWKGKQIVPAEWVKAATRQHIPTSGMNEAENHGYGYFWWMNDFGGFSAHGTGGQYIFVVPRLDLVVVFTGMLAETDFPVPYRLMTDFVLPAVVSSRAISPDPAGNKRLDAIMSRMENPDVGALARLPPLASRISGRRFQFREPNPVDVSSFAIEFGQEHECNLNLSVTPAPNLNFSVPVGLDNRYRHTRDSMLGDLYVKGRWLDGDTMEFTLVRPPERLLMHASFDSEGVTFTIIGTAIRFRAYRAPAA